MWDGMDWGNVLSSILGIVWWCMTHLTVYLAYDPFGNVCICVVFGSYQNRKIDGNIVAL